jgi:hypothetical protein
VGSGRAAAWCLTVDSIYPVPDGSIHHAVPQPSLHRPPYCIHPPPMLLLLPMLWCLVWLPQCLYSATGPPTLRHPPHPARRPAPGWCPIRWLDHVPHIRVAGQPGLKPGLLRGTKASSTSCTGSICGHMSDMEVETRPPAMNVDNEHMRS